MIPELIDNVLPEGMHSCTIDEVDAAFGRFWKTDRRIKLTVKLKEFVEQARKSNIVVALIVDGSYVTAKATPDDIDVVVVLRPDADLSQLTASFAEMLKDRRRMRLEFAVDARTVPDCSDKLLELIDFYSKVRLDDPGQSTSRLKKGLLRIEL